MSCGVGGRRGWDPALLWLWCRLAAPAPIQSLAWELPYATGAALKRAPPPKKVSGVATSVVWVVAVAWTQSLAQAGPHATSVDKKKKKKKEKNSPATKT